jgi:hypothetical protein
VQRDFEFININTDDGKNNVFEFLKKEESSGKNYIMIRKKNDLLKQVADENWNGKLPYTLLIEPGGKIVYSTQLAIQLEAMRKMIFNDPYIGRLYK